MAMETTTTSNLVKTRLSPDGYQVGQSTADYVAFYGTTPVIRPSGAGQAQVTDSSGGSASATTGIQALTAGYNSAILANAIATLAAQGNALRAALLSVGLIKGSS